MGISSRTAEPDYTRVGADERAWRELIHDRLRSLRNGMLALGVLVVVALGLALWGLLTAQTARDERATVSVSRARSLERRIDRLEAQVARAPSAADVARIEGRLQAVEATADLDAYSRADALEAAIDDLPRRPIRSGMSTGVDLRARLRAGIASMNVEQHLREHISTPIRGGPRITLEEFDGDEVVVRIGATPRNPADGPQLASEVLRAVAPFVRAGD